MCLGDFNLDLLNINNSYIKKFNSLLSSTGLNQVIESPTRVTGNSSTLIDFVITSEFVQLKESGTVSVSDVSDHELVFADILCNLNKTKETAQVYRNFKQVNEVLLYDQLRSIPWNNIFDMPSIEEKVDFFNNNINTLMNIHAPLKSCVFKKPYNPWFTDTIKQLINLKRKALVKFKKTKNEQHWKDYKDIKNFTNKAIVREKKAYLRQQSQMNGKSVWNAFEKLHIYKKNKNNFEIPAHISDVNLINQHFISSVPNIPFNEESFSKLYHVTKENVTSVLSFSTIGEMDISRFLFSIKTRAVGADGIHIDFIIMCCPFLLKYISYLVNFCIQNSVYPSTWKLAHVVPLPKNKAPQSFNDLRPISILPVLSKIIEYAIKQQLVFHMEKNNILPDVQSGFRRGHGCATALLNVTDYIFKALDSNLCTVLIMLDYSRAFDTLSHTALVYILKYFGLSESAVSFFESYLRDRKQAVLLKGITSNFIDVPGGVPQGSVLGPVLFSLYTAMLPTYIKNCGTQMYADDTQIFYSFSSSNVIRGIQLINEDLSKMHSFSVDHCLQLNPKKCVAMLFARPSDKQKVINNLNITLNNETILFKDEVRNLGLIMDTELRFEKHISNCIKKAIVKLKLLYNSKQMLNQKLRLMLCDSLVLSIFNYCDVVYGSCLTAATAQRVQRIQNCCLRFIFGVRRRQPISHKLLSANWLNMRNRRKYHCGTLYHKIVMLRTPSYLYKKICFRTDVHTLNIRFKGTLTPPAHKTTQFERSFSYQISKLYNSLLPSLKTHSLPVFQRGFRAELLAHQ